MIELKNITKKFDVLKVLDNINLICKQQTTVLIGPSGCGKSTLLRIITGLIKPDKGSIYINGDLLDKNNLLNKRRELGYVIQEGGLFPHKTARQNVTLLVEYLDWDKNKINERVEYLRDLTKFPLDALERYPSELSGGQKQRVSLMRALMLDPDILLLDEPLGSLDPLIRYDLQTDLLKIFELLKKTVLMVTHDLAEAVYFGNNIVLMKDGRILQQGEFRHFIDHPAEEFVKKFIKAQRIHNDF